MKKLTLLMATILLALHYAPAAYSASGYTDMPYRYKDTESSSTVKTGTCRFNDTFYVAADPDNYCSLDHTDPDDNRYDHSHLPDGFGFWTDHVNQTGTFVTRKKSDWAWADYYTSYTKVTGSTSTFAKNCFAYSINAPKVMFETGWLQWTTTTTACATTTSPKAFGDADHSIRIANTYTGCGDCRVSLTSEKNASSPVYDRGWLPLGAALFGNIRKKK
jgi:hypothetical protein